jgi:hypothetical protein
MIRPGVRWSGVAPGSRAAPRRLPRPPGEGRASSPKHRWRIQACSTFADHFWARTRCVDASSNARSDAADRGAQVDPGAPSKSPDCSHHSPAELVEAQRTVQQRADDVHRPLLLPSPRDSGSAPAASQRLANICPGCLRRQTAIGDQPHDGDGRIHDIRPHWDDKRQADTGCVENGRKLSLEVGSDASRNP